MAKEAGFPMTISVDDSAGMARDISNDINSCQISTPRAVQDVTGVDKSAMERIYLITDAQVTLNGAGFNDAADRAHAVMKTIASSTVVRTVTIALSGQTFAAEFVFTDYNISRGADGALTWTSQGLLADGTAAAWS